MNNTLIDPVARWSPDGTMLAYTTSGPEARIHTVATATSTVLAGHIDEAVDLHWSPDSRQLATGSVDNRARIWDPTTGHVHTRITPVREIISLTWHPDGTQLLGMTEDGPIVWAVVTAR